MKIKSVKIFVLVLIKVVFVKSECDSYLECLGSFFDNFFWDENNFNVSAVRDIAVPGYDNVDLEKENLRNILSGVSSYLEEELDSDFTFETPINIFQNINNDTAIYVKTIILNDDIDNIDNIDKDDVDMESTNISSEINPFNSSTIITGGTKPRESLNINHTSNNFNADKIIKKVNENEIPDTDDFSIYYDDIDDNSTDYLIIDYLDLYKDTTNEYTEIKPTESFENFNENRGIKEAKDTNIIIHENNENNGSIYIDRCTTTNNAPQIVFPWVAAIFIKNNTSNQFEYYCDGALLSETIVLTAARCLQYYGTWAKSEDLLVLLGKTSLHSMNEYEKVIKVKNLIIHENYTMDGSENDIAILVTEDPVVFSGGIQAACLGIEDYEDSITTGWAITGDLTPISLTTKESNCNNFDGNMYCAVYSTDTGTCPSHGGLHAARRANTWHLHGIRHSDPSERGFCFDNIVVFTDLNYYMNWIIQYIK